MTDVAVFIFRGSASEFAGAFPGACNRYTFVKIGCFEVTWLIEELARRWK